MVTKQIPAGTVAALGVNPGVDLENRVAGTASAEPLRPTSPAAATHTAEPMLSARQRPTNLRLPSRDGAGYQARFAVRNKGVGPRLADRIDLRS
jgi:hypothetical protein